MDFYVVEISWESFLLQDSDCKVFLEGCEVYKYGLVVFRSMSCNEYIYLGLYLFFIINFLQNLLDVFKVIKMEKLEELFEDSFFVEEVRIVIRFVINKIDKYVIRLVVFLFFYVRGCGGVCFFGFVCFG